MFILFGSFNGCHKELFRQNQVLFIKSGGRYLLVNIPPEVSVSDMIGVLKGHSAIRISRESPRLKDRPYWENHFRDPG